jgi:sugar lactone lactonase YvrE
MKIPRLPSIVVLLYSLATLFNTTPLYSQLWAPNINFEKTLLNNSNISTVLLTNWNYNNMTITGISDPGMPFGLRNLPELPIFLAFDDTVSFDIVFSPADTGTFNHIVTITKNYEDSSGYVENAITEILITGTGVSNLPADSGACYTVTHDSDGDNLVLLDPKTGAGELVGFTGISNLDLISINSNGEIYATDYDGNLYHIDAESGFAFLRSESGFGNLDGMAFNNANLLYVVDNGDLSALDPISGASNHIGDTETNIRGLAFDSKDKVLWGFSPDSVYTIDQITGQLTSSMATHHLFETIAIHFDFAGSMFALVRKDQTDYLASIDKITGKYVLIGETGFQSTTALAFYNVPLMGKHIRIVPPDIKIGLIEVGKNFSVWVTISNIGSESLIVNSISDPAAPFVLQNVPSFPLDIQSGSSESIRVTFNSPAEGTYNTSFTVSSDDPDIPISEIPLSAEGLLLAAALPGAAYASTTESDGSNILQIDPATGNGVLIGTTGISGLTDIAINSEGEIYGSDDLGNLFEIDAVSGRAVFLSNPGLGPISAMAFSSDDSIYVVANQFQGRPPWFVPQNLYTVDPVSGTSYFKGETGVTINGLTFNLVDGTLWGSSSFGIYSIDRSTGASTLIGSNNLNYDLADLHFNLAGNLYAVANGGYGNPDYLLSIDQASGEESIIGEIGFSSVNGLAFYNVPIEGKHITVIPTHIDFGIIEVENSRLGTITLANIGSEDLTISDISEPGVPFSLENLPTLPVLIPSGNSENIDLTFSPANSGNFNQSFTISSNAENNRELDISLSGTGVILHPADSGACYASIVLYDSSNLIKIDPETGAGSLIGFTNAQLQKIAINSHGMIYGSDYSGKIYRVDAVTGLPILISNHQLGYLEGMAYDGNDSLYATVGQELYIVDPESGTSNYIGNTNVSITGLSFNPKDGILWASARNAVYTINISNASATLVAEMNLDFEIKGLNFDVAGNLYAILEEYGEEASYLTSIDKSNGELTIIGKTGFPSVTGMTFYAVPVTGKHIRVIPTIVDFGYVQIGDSSSAFVTFSSIGTDSLTIGNISDPGLSFGLPALPVVLPSTASEKLEFTFTASDTGNFNSQVIISSDDQDDSVIDLTLNALGIFIAPAEPGDCYALLEENDGANNGRLLKIDPLTGKAEIVGLTGFQGYQWDLLINSSGEIYGFENWTGNVYRIDAATGKAWFILQLEMFDEKYERNDRLESTVFDNNDILYAIGYPMYESGLNLYTIDLKTRAIEVINNYSEYSPDGIAFDPTDNKLWSFASSRFSGGSGVHHLYSIDLVKAKNIVNREATIANVPSNSIHDAYLDLTGNLYAVAGRSTKYLMYTDKDTGLSTEIGTIGDFESRVTGLAFYNVPLSGKHIRIVPKDVDFKQVTVGNSSSRVFTINNIGTEELVLNSISDPGTPFIVNNIPSLPDILSSAESKRIEVIFESANEGKVERIITIKSDDDNNQELNVSLNAQGFKISPADSGIFYASNDGNQLLKINPLTGEGTVIGSTGSYDLSGLAINSIGEIYGSDWKGNLFRVDAHTGEVIFLMSPGFGAIPGIAFDRNDMLYATPNYGGLYVVDPVGGSSDYLNLTGDDGAYFKGLSFNPLDGSLWGSDGTTIFKINTSTTQRTLIGEITSDWYDRANGLTFDEQGNLFATIQNLNDNESSYFAAIDKNTGAATFIGKIGYLNVGGLAFYSKTIPTDKNTLTNNIPDIYGLDQNYPNPFNPSTKINYQLPITNEVELSIYNLLGQKVATLVDEEQRAGYHQVEWEASGFASGIYYYKIEAGEFQDVKKMIFLK